VLLSKHAQRARLHCSVRLPAFRKPSRRRRHCRGIRSCAAVRPVQECDLRQIDRDAQGVKGGGGKGGLCLLGALQCIYGSDNVLSQGGWLHRSSNNFAIASLDNRNPIAAVSL